MSDYPAEQVENDHLNTVILELQRELKITTLDLTEAQAQLTAARAELAALRAEQDKPLDRPRWIHRDNALPADGDRVIAKYQNVYSDRIVTVWYDGGGNVHFGLPSEPDGKGSQPVTHWMPLPAPPRDLREGGE